MTEIVAAFSLLIGGFFCLVAALGIFRFQDFYARIHAATKASTFGFGFSLLAVAVMIGTLSAWLKAAAALGFLFVTLPIATHLLARSFKKEHDEHE